MKKKLFFYLQVGVEVIVDLPNNKKKAEKEQERIVEEHNTALYDSINLASNVEGKLTVNSVELAHESDYND